MAVHLLVFDGSFADRGPSRHLKGTMSVPSYHRLQDLGARRGKIKEKTDCDCVQTVGEVRSDVSVARAHVASRVVFLPLLLNHRLPFPFHVAPALIQLTSSASRSASFFEAAIFEHPGAVAGPENRSGQACSRGSDGLFSYSQELGQNIRGRSAFPNSNSVRAGRTESGDEILAWSSLSAHRPPESKSFVETFLLSRSLQP